MNYGLRKLGQDTTAQRSHCNTALVNAGLALLPAPTAMGAMARIVDWLEN